MPWEGINTEPNTPSPRWYSSDIWSLLQGSHCYNCWPSNTLKHNPVYVYLPSLDNTALCCRANSQPILQESESTLSTTFETFGFLQSNPKPLGICVGTSWFCFKWKYVVTHRWTPHRSSWRTRAWPDPAQRSTGTARTWGAPLWSPWQRTDSQPRWREETTTIYIANRRLGWLIKTVTASWATHPYHVLTDPRWYCEDRGVHFVSVTHVHWRCLWMGSRQKG